MWTSERRRQQPQGEAAAELGTVTLGGDPAGVSLGGERRWLEVYAPGGYSWRPEPGQKVLVLKAGAEEEAPCVMGTVQDREELEPGQVKLHSGENCLLLGKERLELKGAVFVNGKGLKEYITQVVLELLG